MPSVGQYCKQNECDLVYSLYNKKAAHYYFNVAGSSVCHSVVCVLLSPEQQALISQFPSTRNINQNVHFTAVDL